MEESYWDTFDKKLAQEEIWIRQGVKARRCRSEGRVKAPGALKGRKEGPAQSYRQCPSETAKSRCCRAFDMKVSTWDLTIEITA